MTSVYSVEASSLAFVTPPSSPPPESEDDFHDASGAQTPTQRYGSSSPKQSSHSPIIATHITPPSIHRAPSSTVEVTLASALGTSSSSTSKKSPVPVQTFPTFPESTKSGATADDPISLLEGSLERSLKIAQDPSTPKSTPSGSKPEAKAHPFAHSTAKLELLPSSTQTTAHGIDLEEEARLYAELMEGNNEAGVYEDMTEGFTRYNTPVGKARFRTLSTPTQPSHSKLSKHKPPLPPLRNPGKNAHTTGPSSAGPSSSSNHHLDLAYPYKPYRSSRTTNRIRPSNTFPLPSSSRPPIPSNASYAESVFSADIYLADNTASGVGLGFSSSQSSSSSSAHRFYPDPSRSDPNSRSSPYTRGLAGGGLLGRGTPPPLFAQDVKIDGWLVVGEGAEPRAKTASGGLASSNSSPSSLNTQFPSTDSHHRTPIRLGASQVGSLRQLNTSSVGAYVVYDVVITIRPAVSTFSSSTSLSNVDGIGESTADSSGPTSTQMRVLKRYTDFEHLREALVGTVGKIGGIEHHLASQIPPLPPKSAWSRFRPAFLEKRRKLLEFWLTRVLLHPEIGGREVVREWVLR